MKTVLFTLRLLQNGIAILVFYPILMLQAKRLISPKELWKGIKLAYHFTYVEPIDL